MRKYLPVVLLLISFSSALSQNISGVVMDENTREPLIGVNVILSHTNGTTTNIDGEFSLTLKENEKTITFKYIGFESIIKNIDGTYEFVLSLSAKVINEDANFAVESHWNLDQYESDVTFYNFQIYFLQNN